MDARETGFISIAGHGLEYAWFGPGPQDAPSVVFLHEGLGSVSMWRDFPARVAARSGWGAMVYSRLGHGRSDPLSGDRPVDFMQSEALDVLPEVLEQAGIVNPVLFGHSDGASIAVIHAGCGAGVVRGLILEAPHVFVEGLSVLSITRIRHLYEQSDLPERLARHHGTNTDAVFRGWNDLWLNPAFRRWNIEACLPAIRCPVLVIQGTEDEYGTVRQVEAIQRQAHGPVDVRIFDRCGHAPHRDRPVETLDAAVAFLAALHPGREISDPSERRTPPV